MNGKKTTHRAAEATLRKQTCGRFQPFGTTQTDAGRPKCIAPRWGDALTPRGVPAFPSLCMRERINDGVEWLTGATLARVSFPLDQQFRIVLPPFLKNPSAITA
jgi:hypothetical protein